MTAPGDLVARVAESLISARDRGLPLPSERDLAQSFHMSRGKIREALAVLEVLRVIERKAKSGIALTENKASIEAIAVFAQAGVPLTHEEVYEAVEMRKIHEITAVRLACERANLADFERLRDVLRRSEAKLRAGQFISAEDREFHLEIVRAAHNNVFFRIVSVFYMISEKRLPLYFANEDRSQKSHAEHVKIFEALTQRDSALAMRLMNDHLQSAESYWQDLIGGRAPLEAAQ
jgi:DNA-binding FadR family transcriptional regulator